MPEIRCTKNYPMVGMVIKAGTVLTEISSVIGKTSYKDEDGNIHNFDNSEIIFSPEFRKSFEMLSK